MKQKKLLGISFLLLLIVIIIASCKKNAEPEPMVLTNPAADTTSGGGGGGGTPTPTPTDCDPDTVYFQNDIMPILQTYCVACHNNSLHEDGVNLSSYAAIMSSDVVEACDYEESDLYKCLVDRVSDRMPPAPASALSSANIQLIKTWLQQCAQNNSCR